jgi:hypothetical protein
MRSTIRIALALAWMAALAGCGASDRLAPDGGSTQSAATDQAEVQQTIDQNPEVVEDGLFAALDESSLDATGTAGAGIEAAIRPLRFWREIRSIDRRFEIAFADTDSTGRPTRALVTIHKQLRGSFNIAAGDPDFVPTREVPRDTSVSIVHKRLADHWQRKVLLQRVRPDDATATEEQRRRRAWRIVATSEVEVESNLPEVRPAHLVSLRIQARDLDVTVSDPLALHRLRDVIRLDAEAEVVLTATTGRPDDVVMLLHRDRRLRFAPNGDNTYTARWRAPLREGFHHLGVNALARETLFDDEAPYRSDAWMLHYVVRGAEPTAALEP